ncbi:MAG: hypothetical protein HY822_11505, partial [Acidobacteria bacterium]|nr:hypothetical protein [Acidobacteriota bacterium]
MNTGSACIFIDGENLRHSLVDLFDREFIPADYLPKNADWSGFFGALVAQAKATSHLRSYWYTVDNIDCFPWGLKRLSSDPVKLVRVLTRDKKCASDLTAIPDSARKDVWVQQKLQELLRREHNMRSRFDGWKVFQDGIMNRYDAVE